MCWVMPPASPATTSVSRSASSSEVLPWSTWPMTVTTGARGSSISGSSASPRNPISTSLSATRCSRWPNSVTINSAVSASIVWLIVAMTPMRIIALMTSVPRSAMRLASSWIVIVSGTTTSRTILVCSSWCRRWRSRSRARRTDASERMRSPASSSSARVTVSLPRRRCSSRRTGVAGRLISGRRPGRSAVAGASSSSGVTAILPAAVRAATLAAAALPARSATSRRDSSSRRRVSSSSARFLPSSSARLRASSSSMRRRASSSARCLASSAARSSSWRRRSASASAARWRDSSSALRASCSARTRPARSSAVSARGTVTGRRTGSATGAVGAAAGRARAVAGAAGSGRPGSGAAPGATRRFLRTSTVTVFERPCEKLWRTCPVSTLRRSSSRPRPRLNGRFCSCSLASCSLASVMRFGTTILWRRPSRHEINCLLHHCSDPQAGQPRQIEL